jgi:hypothetical protein
MELRAARQMAWRDANYFFANPVEMSRIIPLAIASGKSLFFDGPIG